MPVQNLRCLHQSSNIKWEEKNGVVTGMFCELCTRHKWKDKYKIHSSVWNETPCLPT